MVTGITVVARDGNVINAASLLVTIALAVTAVGIIVRILIVIAISC